MTRQEYDIAVIGSGAGGLAAATFAALSGAKTVLIESTEYVGGTSAYSAGTTWAPNTRLAASVGAEDSPERVMTYLDNAVGNRSPRDLRAAFVENAPHAIHTLMDQTEAQFRAYTKHPDYLSELDGSAEKGRALEPVPFNSAALGKDMGLIRPPIPEFTILGGLMVDRTDIGHLLNMTKSLTSFGKSIRLIGGYMVDRLRYGRSARLVMGNALVGRLLLAAKNAGVEIRTKTHITKITTEETTTVLETKDGERFTISKGVIAATGGFGRHPQKRAALLPAPVAEHSPAAPGHTGTLHDILLDMGATYGTGSASHVFMAPVSKKQRKDGSWAVFPHFVFERSKPHTICVDQTAKRFVNESRSYHEFALAQHATWTIPAYIITNSVGLKKYGLGMVRPGGMGKKALLKDGYLIEGASLKALAAKLNLDAATLNETITRFNGFATDGVDQDFHRGETVYERHNGDPLHGPNPTLGKIQQGPFYAVRLWPADIGAATGFATDANARILTTSGDPLPRLYACGNDMQSIMGGVYPGPGITIGPAITFAYIAVKDAMGTQFKGDAS